MTKKEFMKQAIKESACSLKKKPHGGPFGAVIVKDGKIIASAHNKVIQKQDPTAHAEMEAIRKACKKLKTFNLQGCDIYTSSEPCPMCFSAIMWARIDNVYYANSRTDAAKLGFDDSHFYAQISKPKNKREINFKQISKKEANEIMKAWNERDDVKLY